MSDLERHFPRENKFSPPPLPEGLLGVCTKFEAPDDVKDEIVRRLGGLIDVGAVPLSAVEAAILDTMAENSGLPEWSNVQSRVGEIANETYHELKNPHEPYSPSSKKRRRKK